MRANVVGVRETLARGQRGKVVHCRRCGFTVESLHHVMGACRGISRSRCARHNKICKHLCMLARREGWTVETEKAFRLPAGNCLKPDLVATKGGTAMVIDVTVKFERNEGTLHGAYLEKVAKYSPLIGLLTARQNTERAVVHGFPVGARGLWYKGNTKVLRDLGILRAESRARFLARRTVLYSVDLVKNFFREDYREHTR